MKLSHSPMSFGTFLLKGPLPFMVCYVLFVLSPLLLIRLLGLEHASGQREWAIGFGVVALMMLLSVFFLSGRFSWVNGKAGLELILKFHRRVVLVALLFAAIHIVMITPFGMPQQMLWIGIPVLLLLLNIILAKVHSRLKLKYELWRLSHGVFAMVIIACLLMHVINDGRYSTHPVLAVYWSILTVVGILSLFYVHQYLPFRERKFPYKLISLIEDARDQWTITIEPNGFEPMRFEAGQYAFVSFGKSPFSDRAHPFSFCSCINDLPKISFTIKSSGDFTQTVKDLKIGSNVYLYGPYGHLTLDHYHSKQKPARGFVMLASGVGFTPMMSLLRDLRSRNETRPIKVFYACQSEEDLLFQDELNIMKSELNLDLQIILSESSSGGQKVNNRIDTEFLKKNIQYDGYDEYIYFVCGSTGFIGSIVKGLESFRDIPVFNIRFEDFSVYS